ncbi:putative D-alanyl-D-alanine carboxypeptidase [Actinoplanes missouriensis 431]|uniref:Putative D-alanyl-D-alanine carboxypeptidase n=1 Tax=Actinoplanes missouriensis (strain ATCC 14538 / DSM 43046 / CBS 188.64 / JCM 3121 / NBRC 102363 / NCIMB 12654 / NRRL B-3342 / UNCC 431) TaxID=512565 RepID=I0H0L8_ACTM4|nr:M15 family metallopeptidase [Actinoplanes missouriensis]BAL86555.1 putative D-alanyl-D-alanine carboxypeptidase [Actinoplanes missouriensis 431]
MGIEGVNQRIADIQSRIISMQTQQATATQQRTATSGSGTTSSASFASHLQSAMTTATGTGAADQTYKLNSKGVPEDLAAYGNGKIPEEALGQVGNTRHKLWAPAAQNLNRMIEDAKREGINIGITDSYRPYAEQVDLARRKGLYSQGGLAAKPGTSEHGWGMATDLDLNAKALSWMRQHAKDYGFVENVARESWHWAYRPKTA